MTPYDLGRHEALSRLGLVKAAFEWPNFRAAGGLGSWLKSKAPGALKSLKETAIGHPGQFIGELQKGTATAPGSLMRQGFQINPMFGSKLLGGAMQYGMPAYQVYSLLKNPEAENKAESIGSIAGNLIASNAASKPFGMVGSMLAGHFGGKIGGGIGKVLGNIGGGSQAPQQLPQPQPQPQPQMMSQQTPYPQLYAPMQQGGAYPQMLPPGGGYR